MQTVLIGGVPKILCRVPSMARVPLFHHPWGRVRDLPPLAINLTRGLAARPLFRVPPCREGIMHLQTSISSPGFEPRLYGTTVRVVNYFTGWVTNI
ncbi:hypothetical protein TNCV_3465971 [Trichonephila clavipes]|nr:hypothetical protein TNCV_3465971 [Trichonephila clavipes]